MITVEEVEFKKYGGIYCIDEINFEEGKGTLEVGAISFTTDPELIGKRIDEVTAKHIKGEIILIRGVR